MVAPNPTCVCSVSVPCCEDTPLPETLNVSLTVTPPETCPCLNGAGAACEWDGTRWIGYSEVCGKTLEIVITCITEDGWFGGSIRCGGDIDFQTGWTGTPCKPFFGTFSVESGEIPACCDAPFGSIVAVVTG